MTKTQALVICFAACFIQGFLVSAFLPVWALVVNTIIFSVITGTATYAGAAPR